jgi:transposase
VPELRAPIPPAAARDSALPAGQRGLSEGHLSAAPGRHRQAGLPQLVQLGETLDAWRDEIGAMWRLTRNNGITEGFHNKMELIGRQAYGFRNFENYRLRVKVLCG